YSIQGGSSSYHLTTISATTSASDVGSKSSIGSQSSRSAPADSVAAGGDHHPQRKPCGARCNDPGRRTLRSQGRPGTSLHYSERQAPANVLAEVVTSQPSTKSRPSSQ